MLAKKKKSCKEKIIILNTCVLILIFQWGFYNFLGIYFFFLSCILAYLLSCLYLCLFILFVFYAHVFWVSFALLLLLLLFPTFVAAYPFALSCFVLCLSLHLQNQFLSITLVPILIIPFFFSLSLSLLLFLQKFVFLCEFLWTDSCKVLFCKF